MKNWHNLFVKGTKENLGQATHSLRHGEVFCVCEVSSETHSDELKNSLKQTSDDFSLGMKDFIHMHRPLSLAALAFNDQQVFVYCHNATVLLKRGESLFRIARGIKEAVGAVQADDVLLAITSSFDTDKLTRAQEFTDESFHERAKDTGGGVMIITHPPQETPKAAVEVESVFARPRHKEDEPIAEEHKEPTLGFSIEPGDKAPSPHKIFDGVLQFFSLHKKTIIRSAFLVVFLALLFWGFTFVSTFIETKKQEGLQKRLSVLRPEIAELEENPFKNTDKTLERLSEMQKEIDRLKKDFPKNNKEINVLAHSINAVRKEVGNGKITKETVFFDLDLIGEKVAGSHMEVGQDSLTILDGVNKKAYALSIDNKNYDTFSLSKIPSPTLVSGTADALFIFDPTKGVYKADGDSVELIIPKDKDWGEIVDIKTFNSNVYLLDTGSDEVYKYTPVEGGYSDKLSYFKAGQSIDLSNAKNISIDFSVFILTGDALYKYTGGIRDSFALRDENILEGATAVYKSSAVDNVYILDPLHGRVIVIDEDGVTKNSHYNPLLKNALSFGTHPKKGVLFLEKNKIYLLDKTEQ